MTSTGEDVAVTLPIIIDNRGYYAISDLNITTFITSLENSQASKSSTYVSQIPPQGNTTILHNVNLDLNEILARADYLFNDSDLTLFGSVRLNYATLIPFELDTNITLPWGAPLFNFTPGAPEYQAYNATHLRANVPISFQNHSPYISVTGTIRIDIFNDRNQLLGTGIVMVDVPSDAAYSGEIQTMINAAGATGRGEFHVYFETASFNYGPVVINYG